MSTVTWTSIPDPADAADRYLAKQDADATAHEEADRAAKAAKRWQAAGLRARADNLYVVGPFSDERDPARTEWHVYSGPKTYRVTERHGIAACDCPAGQAGDPICKHRAAVVQHHSRKHCRTCRGAGQIDLHDNCGPALCDCQRVTGWTWGAAPPPPPPAPRVRWQGSATKRRDALDEARAHLGYLLHHADLDGAERVSVERALFAVNVARNAG